jgi:RNA polymerase sigma factor (sigma-70 family)
MDVEPAAEDGAGELPFEVLVQALRDRDEAAWVRALDRLLPRATAEIRRKFGTVVARAENAGGEAVASACRTFYRRVTQGEFELHGWPDLAGLFVTIATNKCFKKLRQQQRQLTNALPEESDATPQAPTRTPDDAAVRAEAAREYRRVIDLVGRRLRRAGDKESEIFRLRLQGLAVAEVAARVHCSESKVKQTWKRAVQFLRELFDAALVPELEG